MQNMHPFELFIGSFLLLGFGIYLGSRIRQGGGRLVETESKMLSIIEGALLTLFGLLMGFIFSMAVSRYDTRRQLVVSEANAIGSTWLRSSTLEEPARTQIQQLLREYVAVRIQFLAAGHDNQQIQESLSKTADLQNRLWSVAGKYAFDHRDSITGLYMSSLNDSIDATEEQTAAFEDRIPAEAWALLIFIGFVSTLILGINVTSHSHYLKILLPFVIAGALALILDMDSPRYGLIKPDQPSMFRLQQQIGSAPH